MRDVSRDNIDREKANHNTMNGNYKQAVFNKTNKQFHPAVSSNNDNKFLIDNKKQTIDDDGLLKQRQLEQLNQVKCRMFQRVLTLILISFLVIVVVYGVTLGVMNVTGSQRLLQQNTNNNNNNNRIYDSTITEIEKKIQSSTVYGLLARSSYILPLLDWSNSLVTIIAIRSALLLLFAILLCLISVTIIQQLLTSRHQYTHSVTRQEDYTLQVHLTKPIKQSQTKLFIDYIEEILTKVISEKIHAMIKKTAKEQKLARALEDDALLGSPEKYNDQVPNNAGNNRQRQSQQQQRQRIQVQTQNRHHQQYRLYLQAITHKLSPVNQVILLNQQKQQSDTLLVVFSFPEIKHQLLEYFGKQQNMRYIASEIRQIKQAASVQNYIYEKVVGCCKQQFCALQQEKLAKSNNFRSQGGQNKDSKGKCGYFLWMLLAVFVEVVYIVGMGLVVCFSKHPQWFISQTITAEALVMIGYGCLAAESVLMLGCTVVLHQRLIDNRLIRAQSSIKTFSQYLSVRTAFNIILLVVNLLIVPVITRIIAQIISLNVNRNPTTANNINSSTLTIKSSVWGQYSLCYLYTMYIFARFVVVELFAVLIRIIKHNKCNYRNVQKYQQRQQSGNNMKSDAVYSATINNAINVNQLQHYLYELLILFSISIFVNPFISFLYLPSLANKIYIITNYNHSNNINTITNQSDISQLSQYLQSYYLRFNQMCFVAFCDYLVSFIKCVVLVFLVLCLFLSNGLFVAYCLIVRDSIYDQYYLLVVFAVIPLVLLIYVLTSSHSTNCINKKISACKLLPQIEIPHLAKESIIQHNQNNTHNNLNKKSCLQIISLTHTKQHQTTSHNNHYQKQIANLIIQHTHSNQLFLHTYKQSIDHYKRCLYLLKQKKTKEAQQNNMRCDLLRLSNYNNTEGNFNLRNTSSTLNKHQYTVSKINQELNTMSRSLEQTLKQRLMSNSINPFQINPQHISQHQQQQFDDEPYELKVTMAHSKPKTVRIPPLNLPNQSKASSTPQLSLNQFMQNKNINKHKTPVKNQRKQSESMIECDIISSIDNQSQSKRKNIKSIDIADQLFHKKIRFTDLFDSDQQSIKNAVKKKIKLSIPKIIH